MGLDEVDFVGGAGLLEHADDVGLGLDGAGVRGAGGLLLVLPGHYLLEVETTLTTWANTGLFRLDCGDAYALHRLNL